MMKISIITLFPDFIAAIINYSILKKAINQNLFVLEVVDLRQFGIGSNHQVDDYQYGGGPGMVLMVPVVIRALESIQQPESHVILLTPQGKTFNHKQAVDLSKKTHLIFIAGHYEGFDERIRYFVDEEISIGDYVLTGGEMPALVITEAIVRLLPKCLNIQSHESESFVNELLDYPVYTRPSEFRSLPVPAVLLSGDHQKIKLWREKQALANTSKKRPDLINHKQNNLS